MVESHFDGKRYRNLNPRRNGFTALMRWLMSRQMGKWREWTEAVPGPPPPERTQELRITLVNHTTFLLQLDEQNLLTDPIWSMRASPVSWAGPKRVRPAGIRFEDLPPVDAVLISHDHYDHMDIPTLKRLALRYQPAIYTGLGNARTLARHGISNVVELDWWQSVEHSGVKLTSIPAQHFSGRYPWNRDSTLWCGFMIEGSAATICFAADTALGPHFQQIAERFPQIDVAILPIGAFRPQWFMGEVHMSPEQAVEAHRILRAGTSIASHFGTFPLADDGEEEPLEQLRAELSRRSFSAEEFLVLGFGEGRELRGTAANPTPNAAD